MLNKNSTSGVLIFATIVCLVCALVVSFAAVSLRGLQQENAENEKKVNILLAAGIAEPGQKLSTGEIETKFKNVLAVVVDLSTGELDTSKDPLTYDMYAAAQLPNEGRALTDDPASIKRIADSGSAYIVVKDNQITRVILPIQGYGLWSTLYGFTSLSLGSEGEKITGLTFYQQAETPGLGTIITLPSWQAKWVGVQPYNAEGQPDIVLSKNRNPAMKNQVDAIAGATLTSNGVQNLMNFWLGNQGYKKFLENLQSGKITLSDMRAAEKKAATTSQGNNS